MIRKLLLLFILVFTANQMLGDTPPPTTLTPVGEDSDYDPEKPIKGHRTPPAPIICFIDIENGIITGTSPLLDTIEEYQLWDTEGESLIVSATDQSDFFASVRMMPKDRYMLKLKGIPYTLIGFIEL
ncbi:MAG: hypothetical protein K2G09_01655 [Paramuribaculum sp.]|nr:hypothetical protein [Paramuribaculum sp.]